MHPFLCLFTAGWGHIFMTVFIDDNGVPFLTVTRMGSHNFEILGVRIFW